MKKIADELKKQQIKADMQEQNEFWDHFNQRVDEVTQDLPEVERAIQFPAVKLLKVAACFLVVSTIIFTYMMYNKPLANNQELQLGSSIEDYEIYTPNDGVMILTDDQSSGTILWVIDSETKTAGEKS